MLLTLHLHTCVISTLKAMLPTPARSLGLNASTFIVQSATLLEKLLSESFMVLVAGILCNAVIAASPSQLSTGSANAEFLGCHAPRTSLMDTHALPCAVNMARLSLRMQGPPSAQVRPVPLTKRSRRRFASRVRKRFRGGPQASFGSLHLLARSQPYFSHSAAAAAPSATLRSESVGAESSCSSYMTAPSRESVFDVHMSFQDGPSPAATGCPCNSDRPLVSVELTRGATKRKQADHIVAHARSIRSRISQHSPLSASAARRSLAGSIDRLLQ